MDVRCPRCQRDFRSGRGQFENFSALAAEGRIALLIGCAGCGLLFAPTDDATTTVRDAQRYELAYEIGRGGMGVTWLAKDRMTGRWVCIKRLHPGVDLSSLRQEWSALLALDHPSIVRLLDFQDDDRGPMLVMEFVDGQSLEKLLSERGVLPEPVALDIALQLCEAIDFVHARGVIHRDIKPANVLLEWHNDRFVPRLLDFGIAIVNERDADSQITAEGNPAGSRPYMAPEQARGELLTPVVDEYGIGVTLAEMLCPRSRLALFADLQPFAQYQYMLATDGIVLERGTSTPEAAELVFSMTRRNPDDRISAADAARQIRMILPEMHGREALAPLNLDLGASTKENQPVGWYNGRGTVDNVSDRYAIGTVLIDGEPALEVRSTGEMQRFGTAMQRVAARHLMGHRIRLVASVATRGCRAASLWIRADDPNGVQLAFDNMSDRALHGTTVWTTCAIDLTVPKGTEWLNFGVLLDGGGSLAARRFSLVDVDHDGRDLSMSARIPPTINPVVGESQPPETERSDGLVWRPGRRGRGTTTD